MSRLRLKIFLWAILMISVVLKSVHPASVTKSETSKATKSPVKSRNSTNTTTLAPTLSTAKSRNSSRRPSRPKNSSKKTTTTTTTIANPVESSMEEVLKMHYGASSPSSSSSSSNKKKQNTRTTTTTTLSPVDIMNKIYQTHGLASHSSSYGSSYSSQSSGTNKKKDQEVSSSMDDIYRLHALAMAGVTSHSNKKKETASSSSGSSSSSSSSSSSNSSHKEKETSSNTKHYPSHNSVEQIYQQHSSLPSSMHHILAQHSVQSSSHSSRPQKVSHSSQDKSPSSLSTFMQPLLKQLTPVGAGISVILAPLLLFNGFLTFFSNMSRFLNNFAHTILPNRRPFGQGDQNQNYFQNLGPAHLKRQPRDWIEHLQSMKEVQDLTELILKVIKEAEVQ